MSITLLLSFLLSMFLNTASFTTTDGTTADFETSSSTRKAIITDDDGI
jgi:hypothetical protein